MAAGRRRAGCRAARAIGAASRRCARPCAPRAKSASPISRSFPSAPRTGRGRPSEIRDLMGLLRRFIRNDLAELHQNRVKVRVIGERGDLDPDIRRLLEEAEELTKDNDELTLVVAFNYGARQEIARAAARARGQGQGRRARSVGDHRRPDRPEPRRARPARSRPHHPHQRRAAAVQFPALAGGLQRAGVRADLLAGLRPRRARRRHRRISPPRTPVRRADRADRILIVAGAHPAEEPPGLSILAGRSNLALRIVSSLVLAPLAIAAAYFGGLAFVAFWAVAALVVLWEWQTLVCAHDRNSVLAIGAVGAGRAAALLLASAGPGSRSRSSRSAGSASRRSRRGCGAPGAPRACSMRRRS